MNQTKPLKGQIDVKAHSGRTIVFDDSKYGGVLVYYGATADAEYWDRLWDQDEEGVGSKIYRKPLTGHLPHQLRETFLRWAKPGGRVLEAGCGLATFTVAAHALGFDTTGVDYAPRVIERLRTRFPNIPFIEGDVTNLVDVRDDSFDAVYSPGVCEHFPEGPDAVLNESYRILAPGGILVVSTPCFNRLRRLLARRGAFRATARGDFYQYAFTERHLAHVLTRAGFEIVQQSHAGSYKTLTEHVPVVSKIPLGPLSPAVGRLFDALPIIRSWGHTCISVARKPYAST